MQTAQKKKIIKFLLVIIGLIIVFSPTYMYFGYNVARLEDEFPQRTLSEDGLSASYEVAPPRPKDWVALNQISRYGKWAIVFSEDWSFYNHEGIDIEQMKTALNEMFEEQKFRGASTITQQMVKNVYLSNSRTITRKIHEIILAQKVEKILTKNKILEVYLNVIEYGPGIFGINAASKHYFKKRPSDLSPREGAFLAMMLPSPKRYYTSYKNRCLTKFARSRVRTILKKLKMGKVISVDQYNREISLRQSFERC